MSMLRAANDYEIKKKRFSDRYFVEYTCPHCKKPLTSQEDELGQKDLCPECGNEFAVSPTAVTEIADRRQQEEFKRLQKERDAKRRKQKKEAEARERRNEQQNTEDAVPDDDEHSEEQTTEAEQKPNDPDSWKLRYANLNKYLSMLSDATRVGIVFFGVLWLVLPFFAAHATGIGLAMLGLTQALVLLLVWLAGFGVLYILYLMQLAVIEFVYLFCSTEEETVKTRKELQALNRTMRTLRQENDDDALE